jgi:hypothetical protein
VSSESPGWRALTELETRSDVTDSEIDAFSSRRDSVTAMQAETARQFQGKYGRAPNQRELLSIHRTARASTPESKAKGPIDFDQAARERGSEWTRRFGTPLAGLASHVSNMRGPSCTREASREHAPRDARTVTRAVLVALARVQASRPAWTRAVSRGSATIRVYIQRERCSQAACSISMS